MPYGYGAANYLQFPNDLTTNKDYAGNYNLYQSKYDLHTEKNEALLLLFSSKRNNFNC